ncbi:hypothetical protein OROHE_025981 [Orobanche hederae]
MDMINEVVSVGNSTDTKGICILVVNDDLTCKNIVSEMLHHCNYQVLHVGSVLDVLNAIWETKDKLDLVLTNAHKLESNGTVIVQHIQNKLDLPVILMCADKTKILSEGRPFSFAAYVLKGLSRSGVNSLWQFALGKEKDKMSVGCREERNVRKALSMDSNIAGVETNKASKSISDQTEWFNQRRKRKESLKEKSEGGEEDRPIAKKPRVVWTREMHQKFVKAIEIIGYEKAVPKKIVEVMGIPGLTRENVASHLQKFRGSTKRSREIAKESISTIKSHYPNTILIGATLERKNHGYFPELQSIPNFGTYGDRTRNALYNDQPLIQTGNFVGYKLTNDGNSIEFGNIEASTNNDQEISIQSTTEKPGNDFTVQDSMAFSQMAQSFDDFLDEAILEGTQNKYCSQLDWEEFDDVLFEHDY